tara:strand:+ start:63 stop:710 length:648 start_codon:yes stop_codon:yes gene_type:complete
VILQSKAIVIKSFSYSESSLISRILLENGEKISIMIKGAKNLKNNKSVLFESMNFIDLNYYHRDTRDIQLFKEGCLMNDFGAMKSNFDTMKYGLCIIDVIDKALPREYKDYQMFNIAYKCLNKIDNNENYKITFLFFLLSFSHYNGYSINNINFNTLSSDKALDLFMNGSNENDYKEIINFMEGIDLDQLIKKTLSFIQSYIPEISHVKSLKFIN